MSVIVPAYGHEAFVTAALDSVFAQTHAEVELIVIDDCSQDATFERIQAWAAAPERGSRFVRIVVRRNEKNLGAHGTLNLGLDLAQGTYISLLNSDDMYAPERLATLIAAARRTGGDFLFSGVKVVDENGKRCIGPGLPALIESRIDVVEGFPSVSYALLSQNVAISTGNFFFSKRLQQRIGKFKSYRLCHDWDFILRATLLTEPVIVSSPLYYYRIHKTNSFSSLKREELLEPIALIKDYFSLGKMGFCENTVAPTARNWPGFFDFFGSSCSSIAWLMRVSGGDRHRIGEVLQHLHKAGAA